MRIDDVCFMSAVETAELVRHKKISPVEVVDALLVRIERVNPKVNAYCTLLADEARTNAREAEASVMRGEKLGPLHGVPFSIKDLVFTKGIRTTGGSKIYQNFVPEADAIVVERLKAAGAIPIGKTNTPEFGYKGVTDNLVFGITRNPWNLEKTSGGSSGGAGASVAAGLAPLAIGSDGGGSIRIPSSFCGIFGLKPSFGRVPQYPGFGGWESLSHTGPMTRTVRDAALMLDVIAGPDDRDRHSLPDFGLSYFATVKGEIKGLRIAWTPDLGYAVVDSRVRSITENAVQAFSEMGCEVDLINPDIDNPESIFGTIVAVETAAALQDKFEEWKDRIDPPLVKFVKRGKGFTANDYVQASFKRQNFWQQVRPIFTHYDLLLTPTLAVPPFEATLMQPKYIEGQKVSPLAWLHFTYPFNLTGQPAATVPCGWTDDGLPIGLQIVGRRFDDLTVLNAAAAFEAARPWADRKPTL